MSLSVAQAHICPYCTREEFSAPSETLLLTHVRVVHSLDPNFRIQCSKDGCARTFKNFRTYQNHLLTHDRVETQFTLQDINYNSPDASFEVDQDQPLPSNGEMQSYIAKWILKTSESQSLTRQALLGIVEDTAGLVSFVAQLLSDQATDILARNEVEPSVISQLAELFSSKITKPFDGLSSFHQQLRYYREHFNLIEPERLVLKRTSTYRLAGRQRKVVVKKTEMMYIPLLKTLQNLLNNDAILQEVENSHKHPSGLLRDYCDSQHFSKHHLFSADPTALQIVLYYDELELCNPLGSRRKKHKIGAFYYMLGNIRPQFRSRINTIQLLALVTYNVVAEFGIDRIIEPIIKDLQKLESTTGVPLIINGEERYFHGALTIVSADNPASSLLSGFKQSASAFRFCRHCMGTEEDIQSKFVEASFRLRCASDHLDHCKLVEQEDTPVADRQHFSIIFGVNRHALIDTLNYVDVTSGCFIPDIMHDILEGALPLETKLMLKVFVLEEKYLTLKMVDEALQKLNIRAFDGDKPSPLVGISLSCMDGNLHQHAMQMWTLARFLPLAISHYIPLGNEHWENFLRLLEIMDIIFARSLPPDECGYLESLISDHHLHFKELYPDSSVTLKMHSMVHMPRLILKFGPLINHWTTRFEAKHKYFKRLANAMGNFTNICYSLSLRHQLYQCYLSIDSSTLVSESVEVGPGSEVQCPLTPFWRSSNVLSTSTLFRANWVKVNGTDYRTPFTLIVGKDPIADDLVFGNVTSVYVNGESILFEFLPMVAETDIHSHSFILSTPSILERNSFLIRHCDLLDYHPYGMYALSSLLHVVVRSNIFT